jgi:gamma-glutamylcyclotransferase (GGCT)/AIG2-like uncharacterized protein YtfP
MLYFAYGSNMERVQMKRLCPGGRFVSTAKLKDYELAFTKMSTSWGGGVADLRPAKGKVVEGVLWEITDNDLKALDDYEGYPSAYIRRSVAVEKPSGEKVTAIAYFVAKPVREYVPSKRYMSALIQGAEEHDLSPEYIAFLEGVRTTG